VQKYQSKLDENHFVTHCTSDADQLIPFIM
jgi:hypothetical protein